MIVRLFTKDGAFVHEQIIPSFHAPPDVILWGDRVFVAPSVDGPVARHLVAHALDGALAYEEAFAYGLQ